jgi:tRNA pseudouridine38-40 synthase
LVLPLNFYKLILQYKGTNYSGFQIQAADQKTIQGELNKALGIITKSENIKSLGSGRTDAGVHATGQVVRIAIPLRINEMNLVKAINSHLPNDIRVLHAEICDESFHPIFSAKSKEYNYIFSCESPSPFVEDLISFYPHDLDIAKINSASKVFIGEHDFINFQCQGTEVATTIRSIYECEVIPYDSDGHWGELTGKYFVIRVVGNGFLKQMVRLMVGALWNIGRGKITESDLKKALLEPQSDRLGATAPPQGLYLKSVQY